MIVVDAVINHLWLMINQYLQSMIKLKRPFDLHNKFKRHKMYFTCSIYMLYNKVRIKTNI